jgi:L-amino acid N-acyltransferase YncA
VENGSEKPAPECADSVSTVHFSLPLECPNLLRLRRTKGTNLPRSKNKKPQLRPLELKDVEQVTAIYAYYVASSVATFDEIAPDVGAWSGKAGSIVARGFPFLVAEVGGEVAGFGYATVWRPRPAHRHTVEDTIYVAPDRLRQGLGRLLLEGVIEGCRNAGVEQVIAVIADTGDPACEALHKNAGFSEVGRLSKVGFKHGQWIDTVLMQLSLDTGES